MLDIEELKEKKITELSKIAQDMNISGFSGLKKSELIFRILEEQTAQEGLIFSKGVLEILPDGYGFLRSQNYSYLPGPDDIFHHRKLNVLAYVPVIRLPVRFVLPKTMSVSLPCSVLRPLILRVRIKPVSVIYLIH